MAPMILSRPKPMPTLGRPPIPREHGAWVMLYVPLAIGLAGVTPFQAAPAALLTLAVTSAFLAQNAAGLLLKPKPKAGTGTWLAIFLAALGFATLALLGIYGLGALLWLAPAIAALFGIHAALLKGPAVFRLDRFQWGQLLAVGGLTLTAPAAWVVARGGYEPATWLVWAACVLFFGSGVFNVNMHFAAAKTKGDFDAKARWAAGREVVTYHLLLVAILAWALPQLPIDAAALAALGFAPIVARAVRSYVTLAKKPPSLKRVGLVETGFALWFALCLIVALRLTLA